MGRPEFNNYTFYKFSCKTEDIECCYVGSTANFLARQRRHKLDCNNANRDNYNIKLYETIRANGGWENWTMTIIGEAENISLKDARMKEEEYRVNLKAELNMIRAYRSDEIKKEQQKSTWINWNNKETTKNYKIDWYETNKEKILENRKVNYENNKTILNKIHKEYYEKNKDKINEKRRLDRLKQKEMKSLEK